MKNIKLKSNYIYVLIFFFLFSLIVSFYFLFDNIGVDDNFAVTSVITASTEITTDVINGGYRTEFTCLNSNTNDITVNVANGADSLDFGCANTSNCGALDQNSDSQLGIDDFAGFAQNYLKNCNDYLDSFPTCGSKDTNANGHTDLLDFSNFARSYYPVTQQNCSI